MSEQSRRPESRCIPAVWCNSPFSSSFTSFYFLFVLNLLRWTFESIDYYIYYNLYTHIPRPAAHNGFLLFGRVIVTGLVFFFFFSFGFIYLPSWHADNALLGSSASVRLIGKFLYGERWIADWLSTRATVKHIADTSRRTCTTHKSVTSWHTRIRLALVFFFVSCLGYNAQLWQATFYRMAFFFCFLQSLRRFVTWWCRSVRSYILHAFIRTLWIATFLGRTPCFTGTEL